MPEDLPDHYKTLGLDYDCSAEDVKAAYRFLAKEHHPDVNPDSKEARAMTQALNDAYETLSNKTRRREYNAKLRHTTSPAGARGARSADQNIAQDVHLKLEQLLRGSRVEVRVDDPGNGGQTETYDLDVPALTAPNAKFRISRSQNIGGGTLTVRVKALPDFRFRPRSSDLRCDLQLSADFARTGGTKSIEGPLGGSFEIEIPPNVARGEIIRIEGEGLAKSRGGRGDILVRINYRPQVRTNLSEPE